MSATARVTVNPRAVSMAASIRTAAGAAPLLVLTARALADLAEELSIMEIERRTEEKDRERKGVPRPMRGGRRR